MAEAHSAMPLDVTDEPPSGPAAAALLASGVGAVVLGILTTWAEASTSLKDWLQWSDRVGPLTGKVLLASIAFFVSWAVLGLIWKDKNPDLRPVVIATVVLLAVGFLFTFPTFFQAFE